MHSKKEKDIVPEPVEPGGVHPELGGQVNSQRQSAVHGVVEESPAQTRRRESMLAVFLKTVKLCFYLYIYSHKICLCLITALYFPLNCVHLPLLKAFKCTSLVQCHLVGFYVGFDYFNRIASEKHPNVSCVLLCDSIKHLLRKNNNRVDTGTEKQRGGAR